MKKTVKARAKEPSTWAGIAALAGLVVKAKFPAYAAVIDGVTALAATLAVGLPERAKAE